MRHFKRGMRVKQISSSVSMIALCAWLGACGESKENVVDPLDPNVAMESGPPSAEVRETPPPSPQNLHLGDRTLGAPSDFLIAVAFYNIVGLEPPFDAWARDDPRARQANEFERAEIAGRIQQELLLAAQGATGIGYIEINTNSNFGEYDMAAQGFRLQELDSKPLLQLEL